MPYLVVDGVENIRLIRELLYLHLGRDCGRNKNLSNLKDDDERVRSSHRLKSRQWRNIMCKRTPSWHAHMQAGPSFHVSGVPEGCQLNSKRKIFLPLERCYKIESILCVRGIHHHLLHRLFSIIALSTETLRTRHGGATGTRWGQQAERPSQSWRLLPRPRPLCSRAKETKDGNRCMVRISLMSKRLRQPQACILSHACSRREAC